MFKVLLLTIFVIAASAKFIHLPKWAHVQVHDNKTNPLTLFLSGFNDELKIANGQDLDKCVSIPLLKDINKTLTDLNQTKPNYLELVADVLALYADFQNIKKTCPQVASVYEAYFSNFTKEAQANPPKTFIHIVENVAYDAQNFSHHVKTAQVDYEKGNYYSSGTEVADCAKIALKGYIAV